VQEALTNVIKHSPGAHVRVRLERRGDDACVDIVDDGGTPVGGRPAIVDSAGGRGVIGMRERASTYGGTLHAGPTESGGYAVRAVLPIPAAESGVYWRPQEGEEFG
jgi:signal transduction histidine kinase